MSLVVPCFNEESVLPRTIPPLIEALSKVTSDCEIVLVNNGSTDGTQAAVESLCAVDSRIRCERLDVNQGYGAGVLAGYAAARGDFVGHIPADGPVSPEEVARLAGMSLRLGAGHLVSAVRSRRRETVVRRIVSRSYNTLFFLLYGPVSWDINGTPKFVHRDDWSRLGVKSTDYFLEPEMMVRGRLAGLQVHLVRVRSLARPGGASKVSARLIGNCLEFLRNMVRLRWTTLGAGRPRRTFADSQAAAVADPRDA